MNSKDRICSLAFKLVTELDKLPDDTTTLAGIRKDMDKVCNAIGRWWAA